MQIVVHCCCPIRSEHSAMMKVSWLWCLSLVATASASAGGIAWPGAIPVASGALPPLAPLGHRLAASALAYSASLGIPPYNTLLGAPATKGFAYSTTQYINSSPYTFGYNPQFVFQVPQYSAFSPLQTTGFYPFISTPASAIVPGVFPSLGVPEFPQNPTESAPSFPSATPSPQPSGESDSTIIESDKSDSNTITSSQQFAGPPAPAFPDNSLPPSQSAPVTTFPVFSPEQQDSSIPAFPSIQFPQGSIPGFPQFPQFPQFPLFPQAPQSPAPEAPSSTTPPPSFPAAENNDRELNDEDTVSIESA